MNTPAHVIVSLAALGGGERRAYTRSIAFGALLPDLPMFVFFAWETFAMGVSQRVIWDERYFAESWQLVFDVFNSIPLALGAAAVAYALGRRAWLWGSASLVVHALLDLPVHREDAHRHFLPLTHWRFMSPVSYWDPNHYGAWIAALETALLLGGVAILWRRHATRGPRIALGVAAVVSVAAWGAFYGLGRMPSP